MPHSGGTISATVTLPDGATPPDAVLVEEYCTASWSGSGATGSCATSKSGTPIPNNGGQVATYIKYTFVNHPGATLGPYSCSPSATASFPGGSGNWGGVYVEYRVAVYPVGINFSGTTLDPNDKSENILIGQHCSPDLLVSAYGCTASNWQWSVSGTTFQTWQPTTPSVPGPANSQASHYVDGPGPLNVQNPGWYWNDLHKTTETVSCTATVTPPNNWGPPCPVTASQQVTVWVPIPTATGTGGMMDVGLSGSDYLLGAYPSASTEDGGMDFRADVASSSPGLFADGTLELVQLIIPDTSYTVLGEGGDTHLVAQRPEGTGHLIPIRLADSASFSQQ